MSTPAPYLVCPVCREEFVEKDYFEMGEGANVSCPHCDSELVVSEVEHVMYWNVQTKADYEANEAHLKAQRERQRLAFLQMLPKKDGL